MTPAAFIVNFEEFKDTSAPIIGAKLALAAARMGGPDFTVWPPFASPGQPPSLSDLAQGFLAAHYLSVSPFGSELRTDPAKGKGKTPYLDEFEDLCLTVGGGFVVAGGLSTAAGPQGSGSLVLSPGSGTVALVNGSLNITFQLPQTLPAGTVLAFPLVQGGALYAIAVSIVASTAANLTAPYTGPTSAAAAWSSGAG